MPRPQTSSRYREAQASKLYREYTITEVKCKGLYVISKGSGAHIATGQSVSHARRLVDAIIAAQEPK